MNVTRQSLQQLLLSNVAEIRFTRRRPSRISGASRRMLCTNSSSLLNSVNGKITLNYRTPRYGLHYNPAEKNLVMTWDILMQDFRAVSMDNCNIIEQYPANDSFWKIFNEKFFVMSPGDKLFYMGT